MGKKFCIIPARYNSSRFPAKVLAPILNKPMLQWVYENVKAMEVFNEILIAVDHPNTHEFCNKNNIPSIMTPSSLTSGTDRVAWVVDALRDFSPEDIIVNVQADLPTVSEEMITPLFDLLRHHDIATCAALLPLGPELWDENIVKIIPATRYPMLVANRGTTAISFCRNPKIGVLENNWWLKHIGIYAFTKNSLKRFANLKQTENEIKHKLEQLRAIDNGMSIGYHQIKNLEYVDVNIPEDIQKVEGLIKRREREQ